MTKKETNLDQVENQNQIEIANQDLQPGEHFELTQIKVALAVANNFLMELPFKGDSVLQAAEVMGFLQNAYNSEILRDI